MRALRTLAPGQQGTKKLLRQYGTQLVRVRYRDDADRGLRCTTVELIIAQAPWSPPPPKIADTAQVGVRVGAQERDLQRAVKGAGGRWNPAARVWEMTYGRARALGLHERMQQLPVSKSSPAKVSRKGHA